MLNDVRYRLRAFFRRDEMDREMDAELRFHLEKEVEKHLAGGVPPDEARRRALATFGAVTGTREDVRDSRGLVALEAFLLDLRYAVRGLLSRPVFTAGVVTTLALGIGANATIFGIVDRLLFRSPPMMRDADSVHRLFTASTSSNGERSLDRNHAFATYLDLREASRAIETVAAFQTRQLPVGDGENTREMAVTAASASYFSFFAARPVIGRFFVESDDQVPAGEPVAVLGYGFWQSEFGGRADVLGATIRVGRELVTIIGVAPEGFVGMGDQRVPAVYIPITHYAHSFRGPSYPGNYFWSWLEMIARRRPGASLAAAEAELSGIFTQSWRRVAETTPAIGAVEQARPAVQLAPVQLDRGPDARRESGVATWLAGVAFIVLLIACANVANLLLSRAVSRRREIAVRLALGVRRGRLIRQLLTESMVLAMAGGVAGLLIAQWGTAVLRSLFFTSEEAISVATDGRTLVFALFATLVVALLTGLAPALQAGRGDLAASIKSGAREGSYQRSRLRTTLLAVQASLSVVLLVGAGLFVLSLRNAERYRMGYDVDQVVVAGVNLRGVELSREDGAALGERLLASLLSMPGVTNATVAATVPFWSNETRGLFVPGVDTVSRRGMFLLQVGSPGYFATMGTRVLRGRAFDETDRAGGPAVVVVSEGMARAIWGNEDAIGKCLHIGSRNAPCATVIGIAEETRLRSLASAREFAYYVPATQFTDLGEPMWFARVEGEPAVVSDAIRRRIQRELPGAAYADVRPLAALVEPQRRAWRFGATMFVAFGGLALVLAAVGLYSLMAYDVAQRTQELGVRLALGASGPDLVRHVIASGMRVVFVGLALGGGVALWGSRYMEGLMFQQSPRDPLVFAGVAIVLLVVALVASAGPAFRASRVDPNVALRGS